MSRLIIWLIALAMPLSAFGAEQMVLKYARFQSFDEKGTGLRRETNDSSSTPCRAARSWEERKSRSPSCPIRYGSRSVQRETYS
jgi:hypothetical protein